MRPRGAPRTVVKSPVAGACFRAASSSGTSGRAATTTCPAFRPPLKTVIAACGRSIADWPIVRPFHRMNPTSRSPATIARRAVASRWTNADRTSLRAARVAARRDAACCRTLIRSCAPRRVLRTSSTRFACARLSRADSTAQDAAAIESPSSTAAIATERPAVLRVVDLTAAVRVSVSPSPLPSWRVMK